MENFEFQIILAGLDEMTEEISGNLYEAGCDDGTPFSSRGTVAVGFSRRANSLDEAIRSAIADIQKAGYVAARVEPPDQLLFSQINQELSLKKASAPHFS